MGKIINRFKLDKKAVIWIYSVIILGTLCYSIIWFATGWAVFEVADASEAIFDMGEPIATTATIMRLFFQYHPIMFFFGMMLWAYVNSQRRRE